MAKEIWKDIPGYEGHYQASNLGRIKSIKFCKNKIMNLIYDKDGYLFLGLTINGRKKTFRVNQLIAMAFLGHMPCGNKLVVDHKNRVRNDNRLENLQIIPNRKNTDKKHLPSSSKYIGVSWSKNQKKWVSCINFKGKHISLGSFTNETEASKYYQNAVKAIENGTEIIVKRKKCSSKYKGVTWDKRLKKWMSETRFSGKRIILGYFDNEEEASEYYQNALSAIKKGEEVVIKKREYYSKK